MNLYLAQFKRGYAHTAVYLLRDRTDEGGNQAFGFFRPDYSPRPAARYLHNLTSILADTARNEAPGTLDYAILRQPDTVHDLLLQRSDGVFQLVIWGERLRGTDKIELLLGLRPRGITLYDPTVGSEPIDRFRNRKSITLELSDHPLIIEIRP